MAAAYSACATLLLLCGVVIFRVVVRRDYLRNHRLSAVSSVLESIFWGPVFAFPYLYNPPSWPAFWRFDQQPSIFAQYLGSALIVMGAIGVVLVMARLGMRRSLGRQVNALRTTGPYSRSRNPQIVAGFPIFLGIALRWPSWHAVGWVAISAVCLQIMVATEEEHLLDVFGTEYADYCRQVPRYFRIFPKRDEPAA